MDEGAVPGSRPISPARRRCSSTKASRSAALTGMPLRLATSMMDATSAQCTQSSNSGSSTR